LADQSNTAHRSCGPLLWCEEQDHCQKGNLDGFPRQWNRLWSARRRGARAGRAGSGAADNIQLPCGAIVSRGSGGEERAPLAPTRRRPSLADHDGYRCRIVAEMSAGKSRDLIEQAAQHAVSIRRAMSNDRFQKALVAELAAVC
jgi:hypothetical protein